MKKKSKPKKAKKTVRKRSAPMPKKERGLNFMVQVGEPKALRKDVLEALRDIIIFMQGYETFMRIQEEKVATFSQLREDVKQLNVLMDTKLRKHFPQGKLLAYQEAVPVEGAPKAAPMPAVVKPMPEAHDLDNLENQLKEIEDRLKGMEG